MADTKISQLVELGSPNRVTDFLPVVDSSASQTKKIQPANLPISNDALDQSYPYTIDFQSGTKQTRDLTSITNSDGYLGNTNLSSVYIGSKVTSIGASSFILCTNLTSVTIPNSVTSIGSSAFYYCTSLTNVTIPDSVTSIGSSAFAYSGLTSINIPDGVTSIGSSAFSFCYSLTNVTIPDSVTSIGSSAFAYSGLTTVNCNAPLTSIAANAFLATSANLVIHARASDSSWTAGTNLTIAGNTSVDVIKDL